MPCRSYTHRFVHPYFATIRPQKMPENNVGVWPLLLNFVEDGTQEKVKQVAPKERPQQQVRRRHPAGVCKIVRNPLDPVYTIVEVKEGNFCVSIPLGEDFKPENLDVKVKDREVVVQIKIEKSSEDGTSQLTQIFTKKVALPEEVKVEEVKSRLTPEGVLKIEAPLPVPEPVEPPKPQAVEIPVTMEIDENSTSTQKE